ncbi:MAG: DUF2304 domain-containing protein [Actinomycetota bacterium]|nr:DUF2304 domain-containing protein [Actinomycetota bacterium]
METRIQLVAVVASLGLLVLVLELVRRRRFLERYAILWLFSALVLLALGIWTGLLETIARTVGIVYPPNALFLVAFGFVLVLLLHFSLAVSRMSDQIRVLAQRLALLENRQRELEKTAPAESGSAGSAAVASRSPAAPAHGGQ